MKTCIRSKWYVLFLLLLAGSYGYAQPSGSTWTLTFEDNFDGTSLNTSKWSTGFGWGAKSDAFDETTRPQNVTVSNGTLKIKMECEGTAYWSGAINSRNKFSQRYGYWEARLKLPAPTAGLLPAFWMKHNDDKWPPELDIMEIFGSDRRAAFTVHYGAPWPNNQSSGAKWDGGDLSLAWHTFGVEWDANAVKWYVDGVVRRTYQRPEADAFLNQWNDFSSGAYMMLNIHAKNATWMGGNLSCGNLPKFMEVDYVRAYTKSTTTPPPGTTNLLQNPGFETGSLSPWTSWGNNSIITSGQRSGTRGMLCWWNSTVVQVVTGLSPNTTYTFRGWGKVDAAGLTAKLSVKDYGGSEVFSPNFTSSTSYTQNSVTFTTGSTNTSARVILYAPSNGGVFADDFTLTAGTGARVASPESGAYAADDALAVYPNPARGQVTVQLFARQAQDADLALVDMFARPVIARKVRLAEGPNSITLNTEKVRPGVYYIQTAADGKKLVRKVVFSIE